MRVLRLLAGAFLLMGLAALSVGSAGCVDSGVEGEPGFTPPTRTPCGAAGCVAERDALAVELPAGRRSGEFSLTIAEVESPAPGHVGPVYDIGPDGMSFADEDPEDWPVLRFVIADSGVPDGVDPFSLMVARFENGAWQVLDPEHNGTDDAGEVVSARTEHFSLYSLVTDEPRASAVAGVVRDASAAPLAGARVALLDHLGDELSNTQVGEDGRFRFEALGPGKYGLRAALDGYLSDEQLVRVRAEDTQELEVTLLRDPSLLGGLRGQVQQDDGAAIAGAQVSLHASGDTVHAETTTSEDGSYALEDLEPGTYELAVRAEGFIGAELAVNVAGGESRSFDFKLDRLTGAIAGDIRDSLTAVPLAGARVSVGATEAVSDAQGRFLLEAIDVGPQELTVQRDGYDAHRVPVTVEADTPAELRVALVPAGEGGVVEVHVREASGAPLAGVGLALGLDEITVQGVTTDAGGNARIAGLGAGSYQLRAERAGYFPAERDLLLDVAVVHAADLELSPRPGLFGTLRDFDTDAPVADVLLQVFQDGAQLDASARSTAEGAYRIDLAPGAYVLHVVRAETTVAIVETVVPAGPTSRLDLRIGHGMPQLRVQLSDALSQAAVSGAQVQLHLDGNQVADALADDAGIAHFGEGLVPGAYTLRVAHAGFVTHEEPVRIEWTTDTTLQIVLRPLAGNVLGQVRHAGVGLPQAQVSAWDGDTEIQRVDGDPTGHFELARLPVGSYRLRVEHPVMRTHEQPFEVAAAETLQLQAELELAQPLISGVVTLQPSGALLPGATVELRGLQGALVAQARSDDDGGYRLEGLFFGEHDVLVSASGFSPAPPQRVDIRWDSAPYEVDLAITHAPIRLYGQVLDEVGPTPMDGRRVMLSSAGQQWEQITDAEGRYAFENLPPGRFELSVDVDGTRYSSPQREFLLWPGDDFEQELRLWRPSGEITVVVTDASSGEALEGVAVDFLAVGTILPRVRFTGADGRTPAITLSENNYVIRIFAEGYVGFEQEVWLEAGAELEIDAALQPPVAQLTGQVIDAVDGGNLILVDVWLYRGDQLVGETLSGPQGDFAFADLTPGDYRVEASLLGYTPDPQVQNLTLVGGEAREVTLSLTPEPIRFHGQVIDAVGPTPLAGFRVLLSSGGQQWEQSSDAEGRFAFENLPEGRFDVSVDVEGTDYISPEHAFLLFPGDDFELDLSLQRPAGEITVVVTDAVSGEALEGVAVDFVTVGAVLPRVRFTDAEGRTPAITLPENNYVIRVFAEGYVGFEQEVWLEGGAELVVDAALQPPVAQLTGQVVDAVGGWALILVDVWLYRDDVLVGETLSGPQGDFTFADLAPGDYRVEASLPGYTPDPQVQNVTLAGGETQELTFSLTPGPIRFHGQVTDAVGPTPLPDFRVLLSSGGQQWEQSSDAEGRFAFENLPEGRFDVSVDVEGTVYRSPEHAFLLFPGDDFELELRLQRPDGEITVVVTDAVSGDALEGVAVDFVTVGAVLPRVRFTDAEGRTPAIALPENNYVIRIFAEGYVGFEQEFWLEGGSDLVIEAALHPPVAQLTGQVVDALDAGALILVDVWLYRDGVLVGETLSGPQGDFSFAGLAPGDYRVEASLPGYTPDPQVQNVTLVAGEARHLTFSLTPGSIRLSGRVIDDVGAAPLAGFRVLLTSGEQQWEQSSDAEGRYAFENLPSGRVDISVDVEGTGYRSPSHALLLNPGDDVGLDLRLWRPEGEITVVVTDALSGEPLEGLAVDFLTVGAILPRVRFTDAEGRTPAITLPENNYIVRFFAEGYAAFQEQLWLEAGADVVLNAAAQPLTGAVSGQVHPAGEFQRGIAAQLELRQDGGLVATTQGTAAGYAFFGVEPGPYTLTAQSPGFDDETVVVEVEAGVATTPQLSLSVSAGNVAGVVYSQHDDASLADATIHLYDDQQQRYDAASDAEGSYLITDLAPGGYTLEISHPTHETLTVSLTLEQDAGAYFESGLLPSPGAISGTVRAAGAPDPVADAPVVLMQDAQVVSQTSTDDAGAFAFDQLTPGAYTLVIGEGDSELRADIELAPGQELDQDFELPLPPGDLTVVVYDAPGRFIVFDSTLTVSTTQGALVAEQSAAPFANLFELQLAPGSYTLDLEAPGFISTSEVAQVESGSTTLVEVHLVASQTYTLTGVVVDLQGQPVEGVSVSHGNADGDFLWNTVLTGADGRFALPNQSFGFAYFFATKDGFQDASEVRFHPDVEGVAEVELTLNPLF